MNYVMFTVQIHSPGCGVEELKQAIFDALQADVASDDDIEINLEETA